MLDPNQKKYVEAQMTTKTDKVLAEELGVTPRVIRRFRQRQGYKKVRGRASTPPIAPALEPQQLQDAKATDRKEVWLKSKQYALLSKSFTPEELDFYWEKRNAYISDIEQAGEYFTNAEMIALDNMIQTEIRMTRFTQMEKEAQAILNSPILTQLEVKARAVQSSPASTDEEKEQAVKDLVDISNARSGARGRLMDISREMRGLQETFRQQQQFLELSRQQRTKKRRDSRISVTTIIDEMKDYKIRNGLSLYTRLTETAIQKIKEKWRKEGIQHDDTHSAPLPDD